MTRQTFGDVAVAHVNVVVAFPQMSAAWFINGVWFSEKNLEEKEDERRWRTGGDGSGSGDDGEVIGTANEPWSAFVECR